MALANETEAYQILQELDIDYQRYDHQAITSGKNLDFSLPNPPVKNLLLQNKQGKQFYLYLLPNEKRADLSALAQVLEEKRLTFAKAQQLEELLHVSAGTLTPLGLMFDKKNRIKLLVDENLKELGVISLHPFVNSTTLSISYQDFERLMLRLGHDSKLVSD